MAVCVLGVRVRPSGLQVLLGFKTPAWMHLRCVSPRNRNGAWIYLPRSPGSSCLSSLPLSCQQQ